MATNQTTNYQLNQWETTDQVLRTDFNADNAKIDAALAEVSIAKSLPKLAFYIGQLGLVLNHQGASPVPDTSGPILLIDATSTLLN